MSVLRRTEPPQTRREQPDGSVLEVWSDGFQFRTKPDGNWCVEFLDIRKPDADSKMMNRLSATSSIELELSENKRMTLFMCLQLRNVA